jgi:hypothetical protein
MYQRRPLLRNPIPWRPALLCLESSPQKVKIEQIELTMPNHLKQSQSPNRHRKTALDSSSSMVEAVGRLPDRESGLMPILEAFHRFDSDSMRFRPLGLQLLTT